MSVESLLGRRRTVLFPLCGGRAEDAARRRSWSWRGGCAGGCKGLPSPLTNRHLARHSCRGPVCCPPPPSKIHTLHHVCAQWLLARTQHRQNTAVVLPACLPAVAQCAHTVRAALGPAALEPHVLPAPRGTAMPYRLRLHYCWSVVCIYRVPQYVLYTAKLYTEYYYSVLCKYLPEHTQIL